MAYILSSARYLDGKLTVFEPKKFDTSEDALDFCVHNALEDYGFDCFEALEDIIVEESEEVNPNPAPHEPAYTLWCDNECGHEEIYTLFHEKDEGGTV